MAECRIYNDHPEYGGKEYREKFDDREIVIPPKGSIKMELFEGTRFVGQFRPIKKLDNGDLVSPKALRLVAFWPCRETDCRHEAVSEEKLKHHLRDVHLTALNQTTTHRCHMCKEEFPSEDALLNHGIDQHKEIIVDDEGKKRPAKR